MTSDLASAATWQLWSSDPDVGSGSRFNYRGSFPDRRPDRQFPHLHGAHPWLDNRGAPQGGSEDGDHHRLVLLAFMAAGEPLLRFFGLSLESLQIAGGLVVGFTGFHMRRVAFSPMAIPLLGGPGAMAVVMSFDARDAGSLRVPGFGIGILAIALIIYLRLRGSERISRILGEGGAEALTGILGLIVLAIGVELVVHGIVNHGAVVKLRHA